MVTSVSAMLSTIMTASAPACCAKNAFLVNGQFPRSITTMDAPRPGNFGARHVPCFVFGLVLVVARKVVSRKLLSK